MPSVMRGRPAVLAIHKALQVFYNQPGHTLSTYSQRWVASEARPKGAPELKLQLRELYKRVHPDLFHDHPLAREANEQSFKLLQAYLDSAKKGGELGRTAGVPYNFRFYLHKEVFPSEAEAEGGAATADAEDGLKQVSLVLPPPARLDAGVAEGTLPRATQQALAKLLVACGLSGDFTGGAEQTGPANLSEFVPWAAELARQRQFTQKGPAHQLHQLRTALRLGRRVTAGFSGPLQRAGPAAQAALLRQLAGALDKVGHLQLGGVRLMLGGEYGVDSLGQLWLDAGDSALSWAGYLLAVDVGECHQRQEAVRRQRMLEGSVAAAAGLSMVYSVPSLRMQHSLTRFLERLAAEAADRGPIGGGCYRGVPLCVVPEKDAQAGPSGSADSSGFSIDSSLGFVSAPVDSSGGAVYDYVQGGAGQQVLGVLGRRRAQGEREEDLRRAVERRLRLRRLSRDPAIPHDRFCSACVRLLHSAHALRNLLDGLEVRVSEASLVAPDGANIDIAWDFQI